MKRSALVAAFCLFVSAAVATDRPQMPLPKALRDKAELVAMTTLGKDVCTNFQFDSVIVARMTNIAFPEGDLRQDEVFDHSARFLEVLINYVSRVGEEPLCQQIYRMFGPESPLAGFLGPGVVRRDK